MPNRVIRAGVIAALFAIPSLVIGQTVPQVTLSPAPPQVVVTGTGEATVTPDRATLLLGVQTRATTAAAAGAENARRLQAVLDALRALGLSSEQLSTVNYNVSPDMQYSPNGQTPPRVIGYVVTNMVKVELRKLEDVARAIDAALAKGANEVSSLNLYSSKADSVRRSALGLAVADARADAEVLARAAGGSLGQLLELTTVESPVYPVPIMARNMSMAAQKTPIEGGQQTLSVTVTARWALVGGK
jgi:uncharacterized protein YggE